ncbi:MAG: hypothetical protein LV481_01340 [Methylacidiphilales bacterium]|nr:hypothetical protein [Candidatus Methylacidiphilales bacterium]
MKFAVEIKMMVEITLEEITDATVIRGMAQPAKPREILIEEIMEDQPFEIARRNQRLLDQIKADEALLLRYASILAGWEALAALERNREEQRLSDEIEEVETKLINRLNESDAEWFRGAMKHEAWTESTEDFRGAFRATVSEPELSTKHVNPP